MIARFPELPLHVTAACSGFVPVDTAIRQWTDARAKINRRLTMRVARNSKSK
jgi:hypothetical protein